VSIGFMPASGAPFTCRTVPRREWGRGSLVAENELRARYIAALKAADAGDCQPLRVFLDSA